MAELEKQEKTAKSEKIIEMVGVSKAFDGTTVVENVNLYVRKGESFYYTADCTHAVSNDSRKKAKILWVSSPPNF